MLGNRAFQYDPCKMYQINASERAANQSRLRETRLVLKLYVYTMGFYKFAVDPTTNFTNPGGKEGLRSTRQQALEKIIRSYRRYLN